MKHLLLSFFTAIFLTSCGSPKPTTKEIDQENQINTLSSSIQELELKLDKYESDEAKKTTDLEKVKYDKNITFEMIIGQINNVHTNVTKKDSTEIITKECTNEILDSQSKDEAYAIAQKDVDSQLQLAISNLVISYLHLDEEEIDKEYFEYFNIELNRLVIAILSEKIVQQEYDGKNVIVKSTITIDPDSVSQGISEILKLNAYPNETVKLNTLIQNQENIIDLRTKKVIYLQKELSTQYLKNEAQKLSLIDTQNKLHDERIKLQEFVSKQKQEQKQMDLIALRIKTQTKSVTDDVLIGMTPSDVIRVAGKPVHQTTQNYERTWVYGVTNVKYENGVVACVVKASCQVAKCSQYGKYRNSPPRSCKIK